MDKRYTTPLRSTDPSVALSYGQYNKTYTPESPPKVLQRTARLRRSSSRTSTATPRKFYGAALPSEAGLQDSSRQEHRKDGRQRPQARGAVLTRHPAPNRPYNPIVNQSPWDRAAVEKTLRSNVMEGPLASHPGHYSSRTGSPPFVCFCPPCIHPLFFNQAPREDSSRRCQDIDTRPANWAKKATAGRITRL